MSISFYILPFHSLDDAKASRLRKNWLEEREKENVNFESVIQPSCRDYDILAETILPLINLMLKLESDGVLPSNEEAAALLLQGDNPEITWPTTIPQKYGARKLVVPENEPIHEGTAITEIDSEDSNQKKVYASNYEANNATVDCPMHMDLAADETVKALMNYAASLGARAIDRINHPPFDEDDVVPIMESFGVPLCGDGNPSWAINKVMRKHNDAFLNKVKGYFGGFHLMLESHKKRGDMFGPTHLRDFFSAWRTTDKQLDWVMHPGDPNQIDGELIMYHLAMYLSAIRALVKKKREDQQIPLSTNHVKINPCEVVDYMVQRAREVPIAMCILIELRFAEVIFMLHECEKKSKVELFITATRLLLPLFATNHATKYVSLVADFLVDWYCASPAEKIIFAKGIFTRKTKNGMNIFADRYFEWTVKDLRMFLGKFTTIHHQTLIMQVCATINERVKVKHEGAAKGKAKNEDGIKQLHIDRSFCEVLAFCQETNVWGPGELKMTKPGPLAKRVRGQRRRADGDAENSETARSSVMMSLAGKPLNEEVLFCFSTGLKRGKDFFDTFLKKGDWYDHSRPEKGDGGVSLQRMDPGIVDPKKDEMDKDIEKVSLLVHQDFDGLYTKDELKEELDYLNNFLDSRNMPKVVRNNLQFRTWSKAAYIACVVDARLKILQFSPRFITERQREIRNRYNSQREDLNNLFEQRVADELTSCFFSLKESRSYRETYKNEVYTFESNFQLEREEEGGQVAQGTPRTDRRGGGVFFSPITSGIENNSSDEELDISFGQFE